MEHVREVQRQKKQRREDRNMNVENKLKSRRFGPQDDDENQEQEQEEGTNAQSKAPSAHEFEDFKFKNPLASMNDEDIYLSDHEEAGQDDDIAVDPNEKMEGELSDDDAYVIPKPLSDMEKRRKQIKKNEDKKKKKLNKDIEDGEEMGGEIEIVKQKKMQDYNIDSLAETLVIAKKMLRNHSRDEIIDQSYRGFSFEDHDELPKWFT